jgi:hypothetical protein
MTAEELKALIRDIITIVAEFPEPYRQKSFEILLTNLIQGKLAPATPGLPPEAKPRPPVPMQIGFTIPIDVRAFLQQQDIPEELMSKLFFMEGSEVRPIYKITTATKSTAQIQIALLAALENALRGGNFEFSIEAVRQRCNEYRCYDMPNFKTHFKNSARLFKNLSEDDNVELSPDGKVELAETISEIAK